MSREDAAKNFSCADAHECHAVVEGIGKYAVFLCRELPPLESRVKCLKRKSASTTQFFDL